MADIHLKDSQGQEEHHFVQVSGSFGLPRKSYLLARFRCLKCGETRNFAIAMTGFYVKKKKVEGGPYV